MASITQQNGTLQVQQQGETLSWPFEEILWLEAMNQHTRLHSARRPVRQAQVIRANLVSVEHWLPRAQFWRINRSTIINRARIVTVEHKPKGDFEVVLESELRLAGSRNCRNGMPAQFQEERLAQKPTLTRLKR